MDHGMQNNEATKAELEATGRIAGNTLTLLLTETTIKGELALVMAESIQWLTSMKKIVNDRIEAITANEIPVLPLEPVETGK